MIYVIEADYLDEYRLHIAFSDGREGVVDLRDTIFNDHRKIFQELKDVKKFRRFHIDMDTIVWDNGLDLAPEFLYEKMSA